ncbi:MAG: RluA family pseudouridine synthase [Geobacteraceae bacterium]|nr:RluA family pseudouridine synthase [Geobacteraceae bacterium]
MLTYTITEADHCRQIESFLHNLMPAATRGYMQKLIRSGHILVNGSNIAADLTLKVSDLVELKESGRTAALLRESRPLVDFLYEDDVIAVVNKEPGRSVHNTAEDTGMDLVLHCEGYMERRGTPCKLRPVNRLDRGTSGAVILAKSPTAAGIMGRFIREVGLSKIYLAVVAGKVDVEGEINLPLEGKDSLTRYSRLFQGDDAAVVAVYPVTGRMHQIRKHFSIFGHPVVGDKRYGGPVIKGLGGHALHALAVAFPNPATGEEMKVFAPLPKGLMALLQDVVGSSLNNLMDDLLKLEFSTGSSPELSV